jgi:hypothetical protein
MEAPRQRGVIRFDNLSAYIHIYVYLLIMLVYVTFVLLYRFVHSFHEKCYTGFSKWVTFRRVHLPRTILIWIKVEYVQPTSANLGIQEILSLAAFLLPPSSFSITQAVDLKFLELDEKIS